MFLINCPFCGERDQSEFSSGGEAHIVRPKQPTKLNDDEWLESIALKSLDPWLSNATDEDTYSSTRSIDPLTSTRDMTSDPIRFYNNQIKIANKYWDNLLENFEKDEKNLWQKRGKTYILCFC